MASNQQQSKSFESAALSTGTALLTLLYFAHTVIYLVGTTNADGSSSPLWLAAVTGVSSVFFAGLALYARRPERSTSFDIHLAGIGALVVLANVAIHFGVSKQIWHGYNFVFYQVAVGALITSQRWFTTLIVLTPLSGLVAGYFGLGYIPWSVFTALVILGSSVSLVVYISRRQGIARLQALTESAEASRQAAEEALASSQKNAKRLEKSQRDLQGILDKSPDAILIHQDGSVAYANPAFLTCMRLGESSVLGHELESFLMPGQALHPTRTQVSLRRGDGQTVVMRLSAPESVQFGGKPSTLIMGQDVTDQDAELKAKLLLADRMAAVGVLASGVAHEINNPMAYVQGNLEMLNSELEELTPGMVDANRAELRDLLSDCLHGSRRVTGIVQELRSVAHPAPANQAADLREAIQSAIKMVNNHIRHKSAVVQLSLPEPLPKVAGDNAKISQIFLNLLVNAAHALPTDTNANAIAITATANDDCIEITVQDSGCGMDAESQRRLFEPFYTTKDVGEGSGLGLYFCRNELDKIGGTIEFESKIDVGTTFTVSLPRAKAT